MLLLSPLLRPILEPIMNPILGEGNVVTYLLGPFGFATDQAAPLTSPHTEAGAVGSLTITDTGNNLSASGGKAVATTVVASGNPGWIGTASFARRCGRMVRGLIHHVVPGPRDFLGYTSAANMSQWTHLLFANQLSGHIYDNNVAVVALWTLGIDVAYTGRVVLRDTGAFYLIEGGAYTQPTLIWVSATGSADPLYATWFDNLGGSLKAGGFSVTALGGAWATDYGIATSYKATTTDADTATMTADALVYHTITAQTGVTQELHFRVTDASNYWLLRMAAPGTNTIKVIEVVAGVETERASTAQTFVNATQYRIGVIAAGAVITPYVDNTAKTGYASAATGLSATGVYVSHAGAKLECWPRNPSLPAGV